MPPSERRGGAWRAADLIPLGVPECWAACLLKGWQSIGPGLSIWQRCWNPRVADLGKEFWEDSGHTWGELGALCEEGILKEGSRCPAV